MLSLPAVRLLALNKPGWPAHRSVAGAMTDRPDPLLKIPACRLWQRTGSGGPFLSGRWGGVRVLVIVNPDRADPDDATHLLVLGEAEHQPRKPMRDRKP